MIEQVFDFLTAESWIFQIFIVILAALSLDLFQRRLCNRLHAELEKTENYWDDALIIALRKPLRLLIWLTGISYAIAISQEERAAAIFTAVDSLRDVGVIFAFAWFVVGFIASAEKSYIGRRSISEERFDKTTTYAVSKLLRLSVIITASLVTMQTLGYSVSGVLAFGGVGGVAVGFAAKDLLANFFGGLMIYLDRPFSVGDWVRSPDREIEGTVEAIGWRLTTIRSFDKRPLFIPNSLFNQIVIENPSRMTNRRIYETVGIRYDDSLKMENIVVRVKEMLRGHNEIDSSHTMIVNFNKMSTSSLDFFIYTYTKTTEWVRFHEIKQDVMLKVLEIVASEGAECAFPTSTIHLFNSDSESELRPEPSR